MFDSYEAYKNSGVEWLGDVPEHWILERIKNLTKTQSGTTPQSGLSEYYENGTTYWVRTTDLNNGRLYGSEYKVTDLALKDYGLKTIPVNSVLLAMYGGMGTIGKNALLQSAVTINQSVCAILPYEKRFNSTYLWYYVQYFRPLWEMFADSARKDPNINQEAIKRLWVILPKIQEQNAIANYLDTKTAQIDRKIDLLNQKATQYGKLKQSIINETVTRGLDKTMAMKDSGVEWMGEVPAHWDVRRLKDLCSIQNSNVDKKSHDNEIPVQLCNYVDVYKNEFINASLDFMQATADESEIKRFTIKKNDVLITKDSETCDDIAIPALATESLEGVLCGYHLAQFRTNHKLFLGAYLFRLFQSKSYGFRFVISAKGITRVGLGQSAIADSLTPVPPLAEQQAIAVSLDEKTAKIDQIITTINTQIDKLKELRKTLINDVVTGKIKVFDENNKDKLKTDPVDSAKWRQGLDENVTIEANAS